MKRRRDSLVTINNSVRVNNYRVQIPINTLKMIIKMLVTHSFRPHRSPHVDHFVSTTANNIEVSSQSVFKSFLLTGSTLLRKSQALSDTSANWKWFRKGPSSHEMWTGQHPDDVLLVVLLASVHTLRTCEPLLAHRSEICRRYLRSAYCRVNGLTCVCEWRVSRGKFRTSLEILHP